MFGAEREEPRKNDTKTMLRAEREQPWKPIQDYILKLHPLLRVTVEYCLEEMDTVVTKIDETLVRRLARTAKIALQMAREGDDLHIHIPHAGYDHRGRSLDFRLTIPWKRWGGWRNGETQVKNTKNDLKTLKNPKSIPQLGPRQYHVDDLPYTMKKAVEFAMDDINKLMLARLSDNFFPKLIRDLKKDLTPPVRDIRIRRKDPLNVLCSYLGTDQKGKTVHYRKLIPWETWEKWWEEEQRQRRV